MALLKLYQVKPFQSFPTKIPFGSRKALDWECIVQVLSGFSAVLNPIAVIIASYHSFFRVFLLDQNAGPESLSGKMSGR